MKRAISSLLVAVTATCASATVSAHANVGVYLGIPGPIYGAPPPVIYQPYYPPPVIYQSYPPPVIYQSYPPPVIYQAPPVVYGPRWGGYGYGYGYQGGDWGHRRWRDNGWHRGWEHRRRGGGD